VVVIICVLGGGQTDPPLFWVIVSVVDKLGPGTVCVLSGGHTEPPVCFVMVIVVEETCPGRV
jgi:hypothetical protein